MCNNIVVCRQNLEEDWAPMIPESGDDGDEVLMAGHGCFE